MAKAQELLETYPRSFNVDAGVLAKGIDALVECANACTQCADACLSEKDVASMVKCVRLNLDCADVCTATSRVGSRQTDYDANVTQAKLERWARENFDVESFAYRWSSQDYMTADELPYVHRSRRVPRTFVATGFKKCGLTNGTAGAQITADLLAGCDNPWVEVFHSTRIGDAATVKKLVEENIHVAKRFVKDRTGGLPAESVSHLQPGEGDIVDIDVETVGVYRVPEDSLHAVPVTCTHLGCTLHWNGAETSWDCPCHGLRFAVDGAVLDGPAVEPLERAEVNEVNEVNEVDDVDDVDEVDET